MSQNYLCQLFLAGAVCLLFANFDYGNVKVSLPPNSAASWRCLIEFMVVCIVEWSREKSEQWALPEISFHEFQEFHEHIANKIYIGTSWTFIYY